MVDRCAAMHDRIDPQPSERRTVRWGETQVGQRQVRSEGLHPAASPAAATDDTPSDIVTAIGFASRGGGGSHVREL